MSSSTIWTPEIVTRNINLPKTQDDLNWDALLLRITNLASPQAANDAVNLDYLQKNYATSGETTSSLLQEILARQAADAALQDQITGKAGIASSQFSPVSWHPQVITNSITIPPNVNAWSFGPTMTIAQGQMVTVGQGSYWTIADGKVVTN